MSIDELYKQEELAHDDYVDAKVYLEMVRAKLLKQISPVMPGDKFTIDAGIRRGSYVVVAIEYNSGNRTYNLVVCKVYASGALSPKNERMSNKVIGTKTLKNVERLNYEKHPVGTIRGIND